MVITGNKPCLEVESSLKGMLESEDMDINMLKNAKKTIIFVEKFT